MLFTITGKHIEITEAMRIHAQEKVEKLPRYFNSISQIEVLVEGNEGGKQSVEVIVHAEHSELLVAKEIGDDTYACIDLAIHKLERQLKKTKEKQRNHKHTVDVELLQSLPSSEPDESDELEEDEVA